MKRRASRRGSIVELIVILAVAVGLALAIQALVVKPYRIPSGSMEPTLAIGQRVLVNRIGMDFGDPHVGDRDPRSEDRQLLLDALLAATDTLAESGVVPAAAAAKIREKARVDANVVRSRASTSSSGSSPGRGMRSM